MDRGSVYGVLQLRLPSMVKMLMIVRQCIHCFTSLTVSLLTSFLCSYHVVCDSAWRHDSFSEIAWFIVVGILSLLFAAIAFSYYRQMLDPTSPVNAARAPSAQARAAGLYPEHYNPPYVPESDYYGNARGPGTGTGRYAPPPGPPPGAAKADDEAYVPEYDPAKLPEYDVRGAYTAGASDKKSDAVDPFADFDELGKKAPAHESDSEHDDGAKHT